MSICALFLKYESYAILQHIVQRYCVVRSVVDVGIFIWKSTQVFRPCNFSFFSDIFKIGFDALAALQKSDLYV